MNQAYICDAIRTPFGRYGGALSSVRTDDLGAVPLRALMARNRATEEWLRTDVAAAYDALKADPARALSTEQIKTRLASAAEAAKATGAAHQRSGI